MPQFDFVEEQAFDFQPEVESFDFQPEAEPSVSPSLRADIPLPGSMERPATPAPEPVEPVGMWSDEAENLTKRFITAAQLTPDPAKAESLRREFKRQSVRMGLLPSESESLAAGIYRTVMDPVLNVQDLPDWMYNPELIKQQYPGKKGEVLAGIHKATVGAGLAFTSPVGVATLGIGAAPNMVGKVVAGVFGADMARHLPEQAKRLGEAAATGTAEELSEAASGVFLTSAFTAGGAAHALKPRAQTVAEAITRETGRAELPAGEIRFGDAAPEPVRITAEIAQRAEQANLPATAQALRDLTGQPEAKPEAQKKGVGLDEKRSEKAGEKSGEEVEATVEQAVTEAQPALDFNAEIAKPEAQMAIERGLRRAGMSPDQIPDGIQSVFERALERQESGKGFDPAKGAAVPTYLQTLAESWGRDNLRRNRAQKRGGGEEDLSLEMETEDGAPLSETVAGEAQSPAQTTAVGERNQLLREAIDVLPESERQIVLDVLENRVGISAVKPSVRAKIKNFLEGRIGVEDAALKAAESINEVITDFVSPQMGIRPGAGPRVEALTLPGTKEAALSSLDPKVEARWKAARVTEPGLYDRFKRNLAETYNSFRRHFPKLDPDADAQAIDTLRQFEAVPTYAKEIAGQTLKGLTAGFSRDHLNVFGRTVILRDLLRDADAGEYAGRELPFGYASADAVRADLNRFEAIVEANPRLKDAVARRTQFMDTLRNDLVNKGLLPESVLERPDYFHRQVVEYLNLKDAITTGTSSADVRTHTKGFQRKRTFSSKDYNTSYLEAEFEVISQAVAQIATVESLQRLNDIANIRPGLEAAAKAAREAGDEGATWKNFIPADHVVWQPKRGNLMYRAQTIADRIIEDILNGEKLLEQADLKEVMAVGGKRTEWVIPRRLAETLDDYKPGPEENPLGKASAWVTQKWKQWILLNPIRALKYNLNNMTGDVDIVFAWRPGVLKHAIKAGMDSFGYRMKGRAPTPDQINAVRKGLIGSDFFVQEVPEISRNFFFKAMTGADQNLIEKYWGTVGRFTQWREDTLRLATYRYAKEKLEAGEQLYGASRKAEIDALPNLDDKAVKIARELVGDYGNVSRAGQWMRRHMIPFYSWLEINAPRYVRLFRNAGQESGGSAAATGTRATAVAAKKAALFTAKVSALYALVNLWNHSVYPELEAELNDERRQLHMILGRTEDGEIRTLRVQGALSDALDWFGMSDLPSDMADIAHGRKSIEAEFMEATLAPIEKLVNAAVPITKTTIEAAAGRTLYPDIFDVRETPEGVQVKSGARSIRDPGEHVARLFSMQSIYRWLTDKPGPGFKAEMSKLLTYSVDPGQSAYYAARDIVATKRAKEGVEFSGTVPTERSNALYYYKQSVRYKDERLAEKWKARYFELGGNESGLKQSVAQAHPLAGIAKKDRRAFLQGLSADEAAILAKATEWYERVYEGRGTAGTR